VFRLAQNYDEIRKWLQTFELSIVNGLNCLCHIVSSLDDRSLVSIEKISDSIIELTSSGHWFCDSEFDGIENICYLNPYFHDFYPVLSAQISLALLDMVDSIEKGHCPSESHRMKDQTGTLFTTYYRNTLRFILSRVHLGGLYMGEAKWKSNQTLYNGLVSQGKTEELLNHITSKEAETDLENRLNGYFKGNKCPFTSIVIDFFTNKIVSSTKKSQEEFISLCSNLQALEQTNTENNCMLRANKLI